MDKLKWELVPEGQLEILDDAVDTYGENFPPRHDVTINADHPQLGLFPQGFDSYMKYWPDNIVLPVSIVVLQNDWEVVTYYNSYYGSTETDWGTGPTTVLTMPNGASFTLRETDPWGDNEPEEIFEGDWSVYCEKGSEDMNAIIDVVAEAYEAAGRVAV